MYSIGAVTLVPHEADPLVVRGPRLTLRYATPEDAPRLFELAADPAVTRFFSWGPYTTIEQPEAYIASLPAKREAGELLDFLVVDPDDGPVGVTGLAEVARRDRRATVGSWLGHRWWGSGANFEAKAMVARAGVPAARRRAADRVGEHPQRPLAAGAGADRVPARGRAERRGTGTATRCTTWSSSGCCGRRGSAARCTASPVTVEGTPPPAFIVG